MTVRVAIMAQGKQTRMPGLAIPKQLLWLNMCQDTILGRTLRQLRNIGSVTEIVVVGGREIAHVVVPEGGEMPTVLDDPSVEVGGRPWSEVMPTDQPGTLRLTFEDASQGPKRRPIRMAALTLDDPGNSVLRGLQALAPWLLRDDADRTVVLLGDVVFSNQCLRELVTHPQGEVVFAVTTDLSPGHGEMFGLSFAAGIRYAIVTELHLIEHPPFEAYQAGQMRRLLWAWQRSASHTEMHRNPKCLQARASHTLAQTQRPDPRWCVMVDDYTTDFDTTEDLQCLGETDVDAYHDDCHRRVEACS